VVHILEPDSAPSSWISTTKDVEVARGYARGQSYGGYIVKINQCKIPLTTKVRDVSSGGTGSDQADRLAILAQEVLIRYSIPAAAISIYER
jgi:hypothetical protein